MGAAMKREDRPEHGEPEEDGGGEFVAPDQRSIEDETEDHASEEEAHFGHEGDRGDGADDLSDPLLEPVQSGMAVRRGRGQPGACNGGVEIHVPLRAL